MEWTQFDLAQTFESGIQPSADTTDSFHIVISDDEVLSIDDDADWRPLDQDEWRWLGLDPLSEHYLGQVGGKPVFVNEVDPEADEPQGYSFNTLWSFLSHVDQPTFYLIGRARQIVDWHRNHQFCSQCGQVTQVDASDRSRQCLPCGQLYYPRLSPSIIVLVTRGEELLLARGARARGNFYSTLAGFIEPGESIEEAVHREVFEEVGLRVKNLHYYGSQPWPFPNSLMLGFHAEYDSGEFVLQESEIAEAKWFHYENLPHKPAMVSISGWLINDYIERLKQGKSES
jgi:NAD+ diphosphatase